MMTCNSFRLQIDAYADGALSPSERAAFETHRASCAECQRALSQARWLESLLWDELPRLATATVAERVSLRQSVLRGLDPSSEWPGTDRAVWRWRRHGSQLAGVGALLTLALVAALVVVFGEKQTVSAAEIVDRTWATVEHHRGMTGLLHWEGEWSQRFPSGDQITRTFEIWFNFDDPGRYRMTQRDRDGSMFSEMVRDGVDRMWLLSRTISDDGREQMMVDEIILSLEEMRQLSSWYVPSPFLDDVDRFTEMLDRVEKVAEVEVAGRSAYILRGRLFGFGRPGAGNRIVPVTSTVQLIVDAETYWVLGRTERLLTVAGDHEMVAGVVQHTHRFALLTPEESPPDAFKFTPPSGAEVRTVQGIAGYYEPAPDGIGLEEAANLTSFTLVLPSRMPGDMRARPHFRYQGPVFGRLGTFGIVYLGRPGRQAFLLEYARARFPGRAARVLTVGGQQAWLAPDPIDGRRFSLYLIEPQPVIGADGRPWPGGVELQAWGLSLDEAVTMLGSLAPYPADATGE